MAESRSYSTFEPDVPSKGNVMLVEDQADARERLRSFLTKAGYGVIEVTRCKEAIEAIHSGDNPLVVEVVLINVDGDEGMKAVHYFKTEFPRVLLIAVTGLPSAEPAETQPTNIVLLGGGKGGSALLGLLAKVPGVRLLGVADQDLRAPAIQQASQLGIPVFDDVRALIGSGEANLIIDVTGDPAMERVIADHKRPDAEVLSGATARLLWYVVQHETRMQRHLSQTERLTGMVRDGDIMDFMVKPVRGEDLLLSIAKAMDQREVHQS